MAVEYGSPDLFPHSCAVFTCPCGRAAARHRRHLEALPEGWTRNEEMPGGVVCADCARALAESRLIVPR